jgi:hypothetical protein
MESAVRREKCTEQGFCPSRASFQDSQKSGVSFVKRGLNPRSRTFGLDRTLDPF